MSKLDVLIPTYNRKTALAITLTSLVNQTFQDFDLIISDQTEGKGYLNDIEYQTIFRLFRAQGKQVKVFKHLPQRGMAEQRHFLLSHSVASYVLYLDDDLLLESRVLERMFLSLAKEGCGFVGCAPIGLSYLEEFRPDEQRIEFWERGVLPEVIEPESRAWQRYKLHNAANLYHVQQKFPSLRKYKVAWVGACVMYQRQKLIAVGGFSFWPDLPKDHAGEDVYVQNLLLRNYGGFGIIPSGVYHLELPTTVENRKTNAMGLLKKTR